MCRYDHSGLNETLSRCHVCATTVRNYVCLICGVVSCSNGPVAAACAPRASDEGAGQVPAQVPTRQGHALQHYLESLHAYALDTETQHVWDFAGGGYVHRLLVSAFPGCCGLLCHWQGGGLYSAKCSARTPSPPRSRQR